MHIPARGLLGAPVDAPAVVAHVLPMHMRPHTLVAAVPALVGVRVAAAGVLVVVAVPVTNNRLQIVKTHQFVWG
jgi:hypothetical protein